MSLPVCLLHFDGLHKEHDDYVLDTVSAITEHDLVDFLEYPMGIPRFL